MNLFISYRRSDAPDFAGRLAERLDETPGVSGVFMDVEGIRAGEDFVDKLDHALGKCDAVLAIVGPRWNARRDDGTLRLAEPEDFVRRELLAALEANKTLAPVLANGAQMPGPDELPEALQAFARLNAFDVRHTSFDADVERLADSLLGRKPAGSVSRYFARHPFQSAFLYASAGAFGFFLTLAIFIVAYNGGGQRYFDDLVGGSWPRNFILIVTPILGAVAGLLLRRRRARR